MSSMHSMAVNQAVRKGRKEDFSNVTEMPGGRASREQLSMLYSRYHFAASFCRGKEVLEAGCGTGLGLGYLARFANRVIGVDIEERNLKVAADHYGGRENIELRQMDAQELSFDDHTFDVVILFEALYYLKRPHLFLAECRRILREKGILLINTVNPDWRDFNPSPLSTRYFSARELHALLESYGFKTDVYGAFSAQNVSLKSKMISALKRLAIHFSLIPKTLRGREFLKRLFFGRLAPIPPEVHGANAEYIQPTLLSPISNIRGFKVLYAAGQRGGL